MKKGRKYFETHIVRESGSTKNHWDSIEKNLIEGVTPDLFVDDLSSGSGNELDSKFKAVYSSSALAVNSFAYLKKRLPINLFGHSFSQLNFEKQLSSGLGGTKPNLDVVLENETTTFGIESKFLEWMSPKESKFAAS